VGLKCGDVTKTLKARDFGACEGAGNNGRTLCQSTIRSVAIFSRYKFVVSIPSFYQFEMAMIMYISLKISTYADLLLNYIF